MCMHKYMGVCECMPVCLCLCVSTHSIRYMNNNNYRKDHNFGRSNSGRVSKEMKGLINGDEVFLCEVFREKSCLKIIP